VAPDDYLAYASSTQGFDNRVLRHKISMIAENHADIDRIGRILSDN